MTNEQNLQIAAGAANAVYSANSSTGTQLIVGQPLVFPPDLPGQQAGYTALASAPPGYTVRMVNNDVPSGLNLFVAFNQETKTAIVGIAGLNGVLKTAPGAAADNAAIANGMQDQIAAMFKGGTVRLNGQDVSVPGILDMLRTLSSESGETPLNIIVGGQSGAGPTVDALLSSLRNGLTDDAKRLLGITKEAGTGLGDDYSPTNVTVLKVNTLGSEYVLSRLGLLEQGQAMIAAGASVTTVLAGDSVRNYLDPVASFGGHQFGDIVRLDALYPADLPIDPGSVLGWYHRMEGALGQYLANGGKISDIPAFQHTPLPLESFMAAMNAINVIPWESNVAAYGGLAAMGLFASAFSWPGESAQAIGKGISSLLGSNSGEGFFTAMGGVIEAGLKYAAFTNPTAFLTRVAALLFSSKLINMALGADNTATLTQTEAFRAKLPPLTDAFARQEIEIPGAGLMVIDTYGDRTVTRQVDGTTQTIGNNGNCQIVYPGGSTFLQNAGEPGTLIVPLSGGALRFTLTENQTLGYVPPTDAQGNVVGGVGGFRLSSFSPDQPDSEIKINPFGGWQLSAGTAPVDFKYEQLDAKGNVAALVNVIGDATLLITTTQSPAGQYVSTRIDAVNADKSVTSTTEYPGGRTEVLSIGADQKPVSFVVTLTGTDDSVTTEKYDFVNGKRVLASRTVVQTITDETGTYTVETIVSGGGTVRNKYDGEHQLLSSETIPPSGITTLINAINTTGADVIRNGSPLVDALALVNALRTGQPLPIVSSGLKLANSVNAFNGVKPDVGLTGAASFVSGISSLQSLQHALDTGDDFGALTAGAQTIQFGAQAYAAFAKNVVGENAIASTFGADSVVSEISTAVPYLAIVNDLVHEDYTGAAIAAVSYAIPVIGWAYAAFSVFNSFFGHSDPPPEPWGGASANWTGSSLTTKSWGANGGEATANAYMNQFVAQLDALAAREQAQNPSSPIGVVANRLPSFSYRYRSGFTLNEIDPITGFQRNAEVRYDLTGRPFNAAPGSEVGSQSFSERFIRDALARGAVAPLWEAQTAAIQTQTGDPQAGLTEEERAGRNGLLASKATGTTQYWRPVALDLNGDGIQTTGSSQTVAFDVDDSGFLKNSAWLNGNDGFLVLDRNLNSQIDSGKELFSNGAVDISARGLAGLHWVDANYDGTIDANDAVWNELKVWQDVNGDGQVQAGESQGLAALGISKLNYVMGTFEQNGVTKQLASPDLLADTEGSRVNVVPEGIVVQTSQGNVSLLVTHIDDRSLLEANRDGVTTFEDIETIITSADLLANDTLAGFTGQNLSLASVSNFTHGTGYLDSNGSIHYRSDANYFGTASFDYQIEAATGQTATATVDLNIQNVNDAPTAAVDMANSVVVATDIDDPTGPFTYSVVQQPQQGQAQIGANGSFSYTNWYAPNTPGVQYGDGIFGAAGPTTNSDPFVVRVADAHGAYSDVTVNAVHQGSYSPSLGGGGGGGKKPIAIDLNGDEFQFTNVDDSNVFFDVNGDGWKEKTSWFSGSDAFLVLDEKGDRNIDQVDEISFAKYKHGAQTDLEGLAAFDTNGDGQLTAADKDWSKFGVWQDSNQNGITDAGEFYTLSEQGITAISLRSDGQFSVVNGQTVHGLGSITRQDGSTLAIADVTLSYSTKDVQMPTASGVSEIVQRSQFSASGEEITGTEDNDLILGKNGNNVIQAYGGNDVIFEDGGNDFIDAGDGNDIVYSGADNDVVLAGSGDDVVFAGLGDDLVLGGDGQDALFGEAGNDIVFGGDGNDLISGDAGNDLLSGDQGDDTIFGGGGNDALFGMDGNDQLSGDEGNDYLNGGAGNDTLDGGVGADTMLGGAGDDTYLVDSASDVVTELADEGNDTVRASVSYLLGDNVENLTLVGTDSINGTGNAGANTLIGNAGDNTLEGGAGADHLFGGDGNDTYILRTGTGSDTIQDASGIDRILVKGGFSASDITLTRHDQDVIVGIKGSTDSFTITNWFSPVAGQASTGTIESIQFENGSPAIDASYIHGLLGNHAPTATADTVGIEEDALTAIGNVLTNDTDVDLPVDSRQHLAISNPGTYAGSYGQLQLGVDGAYTYVLNNSLQAVQALAVGETLVETIGYTVQDNAVDNKTATSTLTITIAGTNDAPVVTSAIADQLGREKQALSFSVPGNTFFDVDHGDVLTYSALLVNADGSTQALPSWLSFNATTRTFSGTPGSADGGTFAFSVTATDPYGANVSTTVTVDIADEFAGTGDNLNVLTGSWTNDTLNGTRRSETLIGNGGTDELLAGEGDNTVISTGGDTLITAGAGNDAITSSYGNDTIDAGNGNNWINAGGGNNVVTAGNGNDTITTDWGNSTINAGGGANTIVANGNSTVAATSGAGDDTITTSYGNDTINAGDGNNRINAGGGDNVITAGSGNDTINTDWGNSTINAGDGNNTIVATGGNTTVITGAGADTITTSYGNDVVNSGAGNDTISTGWGADTINAGAGDDIIRTGGGGDTVRGGLGNDTIIADQWSNDTYLFAAGDGQDSIADSGGQDTLVLENIGSSQLWFTHTGNDLNVSVIGTTDSVTLKDWYSGYQYPGSQYHLEQIQTSDGKVLLDSQVQNLVDAMAAFAPPAAGQTTLTGTAATTLTPVLAANWH